MARANLNLIFATNIHIISIKSLFYLPIAFLLFKKSIISLTGLGSISLDHTPFVAILKKILILYIRTHRRTIFIVQNTSDYRYLKRIQPQANVLIAPGSGTSLTPPSIQDRPRSSRYLVIAFVARITEQKGINTFFKVAARSEALGLPHRFRIYGSFVEDNPSAWTRKKLMTELSLIANITYEGFCQDISELSTDIDLLLFPSLREGFPKTIQELTMLGVPTIAPNVAGTNESIANGVNGWLLEKRPTINRYIQQIETFSQYPPERKLAQRKTCSEYGLLNFNEERALNFHRTLYQRELN